MVAQPPMVKPDPGAELARAAQRQVEDFLARLPAPERLGLPELLRALAAHPERVAEIQQRYYREQLALWSRITLAHEPPAEAPPADRRFTAAEWSRLPYFRLLKESYLLHARWLQDLVEAARLLGESIDYGRQAQLAVERLRLEAASATKPASVKAGGK